MNEPAPNAYPVVQPPELRVLAHVVYALQALFFLTAITPVIGVVINYVRQEEAQGTLYESHFRWQIRTFWYGLLWSVIGAVTFFIVIGWGILLAATVWYIYRIVKGWLRLVESKPMY